MNEISIDFATFACVLRTAFRYGMTQGVHVTSNFHYDFLLPEYEDFFDYESPYAQYLYGDRSGRRCLEMMPNGNLYPSSEFFGEEPWCVGNAFHEQIRQVWQTSSVLRRIRARPLPVECRECVYRTVCRGGQYSRAVRSSGRMDAPPDDCPVLTGEWRPSRSVLS